MHIYSTVTQYKNKENRKKYNTKLLNRVNKTLVFFKWLQKKDFNIKEVIPKYKHKDFKFYTMDKI